MNGSDVRAIVSLDPGIKNFACAVLVLTQHTGESQACATSSIPLPSPGCLVCHCEKINLTHYSPTAKQRMYEMCAQYIQDLCGELRKKFGPRMQIDILIEMQLQTNTYTFPLVFYLIGYLKSSKGVVDHIYTMFPRTKLATRVVAAVWKACRLTFSASRDEGAHPFCSSSKATSLTFTDAFIKTHGSEHAFVTSDTTLENFWNSAKVRGDKKDDLADSFLQACALWAAREEIGNALQEW